MLPIVFIRDGENVLVRLVIAVIVSDCQGVSCNVM